MAKKRMVAGYALQQNDVLAPGEPIKCHVDLPVNAKILSVDIDGTGNFVLFAEIWSHPEGTKVNFENLEFAICSTNQLIPAGSWDWYRTVGVGAAIWHIYRKGAGPRIVA